MTTTRRPYIIDPLVAQLAQRRKYLRLTGKQMAQVLGCTHTKLAEYENGRNSPSLAFLKAWADALACSLYLVDLKPIFKDSEEEAEWIATTRQATYGER